MFFVETATALPQNIVISHLTTAGISVAAIQWLKNSKYFPWITKEKTRVLRALAVVAAAVKTVGVSYAWNAAARELVVQIPTLAQFGSFLVAWVHSFVAQEVIYQGTAKNGLGELVNLVRAIAASQGITPAGPTPSLPSPAAGGKP